MSLINIFKGFFIGIAMVIPGLSGSAFALVVKLYDSIIEAISSFRKNIKKNTIFLTPIAIGCLIGILASTKIVLWVCEVYRLQSYMFFIGLVIGSLPLIIRKMLKSKFNPLLLILVVLSFVAVILTSQMGSNQAKSYIAIERLTSMSDFISVFIAGLVSVSLMMVPGISGSVLLMVMGQYGTVYNAVGTCLDFAGYVIKGDFQMAQEAFMTIILVLPFLLGALTGIIFIAKILTFLLKRWESIVYYCVMGLILGAIVVLGIEGGVMEVVTNISVTNPLVIISGVIFAIIGYLCTALI